MTEEINRLHALYCELTEQEGMGLRFDRLRMWHDWTKCGWGAEDLRMVVRYLNLGINQGKRNQGSLKFSNLIGQLDRFEEDLFEARRVLRTRKPKPALVERVQQVGTAQRIVEVPPEEVPPMDVGKFFADLRRGLNDA